MATTLTKSYQRISTIPITYGEIRTYAKYNSQNTSNNTTSYSIKSTYYSTQWVSFDNATAVLDGTSKSYGYTTMNRGETTIQELTRTLTHNPNGSSPTKTINTSWTASYGGSGSASGQIVAPAIKRFATLSNVAESFTDESEFSFSYSNPANGSLSCWLEVNPSGTHLAERTLSGQSGTYTWELTEEERTQLRQQMTTSSTGKIRVGLKTTIGSSVGSNYVDRPFSIINANPIFSNFTFEDINPTTLALTGDSSININGFSTIRATISTANKAEAQKEATMVQYKFNIGEVSTVMNYSDESSVLGTINNASNGTYNMYAIDSRGNATLVTKMASREIIYENVYIDKQSTNVQRSDNQVGDECIVTLNGTFWNNSFGQVTNDVSVSYQFKKSDSSTWIDGTTTITPTITDNKFSFTGQIASDNLDTSWDLDANYDIKIIVTDSVSSAEFIGILASAIPTMSFDKEGVGIMCAYDTSVGGGLQVYGNPIGSGVVDSGNGFVKFGDGTMICYGTYRDTNIRVSNSWGSLYASGVIDPNIDFAETFTNIYSCVTQIIRTAGQSAFICDIEYDVNGINNVQFLRGTSATISIGFDYVAIGTWK